ncbi:MAG TPA: helix-turn-helix transcriptional regulator [Pyrinomonadaceae bacterium]
MAEKLVGIRQALGLSQNEILRRINAAERLTREDVSKYERGLREPSLLTLLEYARAAGVWVDVLIDDKLDLPEKIPTVPKSEGLRRKTSGRSRT